MLLKYLRCGRQRRLFLGLGLRRGQAHARGQPHARGVAAGSSITSSSSGSGTTEGEAAAGGSVSMALEAGEAAAGELGAGELGTEAGMLGAGEPGTGAGTPGTRAGAPGIGTGTPGVGAGTPGVGEPGSAAGVGAAPGVRRLFDGLGGPDQAVGSQKRGARGGVGLRDGAGARAVALRQSCETAPGLAAGH